MGNSLLRIVRVDWLVASFVPLTAAPPSQLFAVPSFSHAYIITMTSSGTQPASSMSSSAGSRSSSAGAQADLSLQEMLRVMDVARELRKDRVTAEQALARDTVRAELREKLLRTAQLSGDRVTAAEIDVAIETYFSNRHQYQPPAFSLSLLFAHGWIRRAKIIAIIVACLLISAVVWGLCFSAFAPFPW